MKSNAISRSRLNTRVVVYAGLLIAVSIVLKLLFEVYIPLGGFPSLRINLTSLPIILSGIILGPWVGMIVGLISDIVCFIVKPSGPFFIGFTISSGLTGLIPGLLWKVLKKVDSPVLKWTNLIVSAAAVVILFVTGMFSFDGTTLLYAGEALNPLIFGLFIVLIVLFAVYPFLASHIFKNEKEAKNSENLLLIVTVEQIFNSVLLNTLFLTILYGQMWVVLLPARIVTNIFLIPLYTIVLAGILKVLPAKYRDIQR